MTDQPFEDSTDDPELRAFTRALFPPIDPTTVEHAEADEQPARGLFAG